MNRNDFSLEKYRELLIQVSRERTVVSYSSVPNLAVTDVLWRHDVDVSLHLALDLAREDSAHRVRSSYFINLHSEIYNAHSTQARRLVRSIRDLGHDVEIHLDAAYYEGFDSESALTQTLEVERQQFGRLFDVEPVAFSFHNPSESDLKFTALRYAGIVNCYSNYFKQGIAYVSDSNGYWRHESIDDSLNINERRPIQILTHAEWWITTPLAPRERIAAALFNDAMLHLEDYDRSIIKVGRENKSDLISDLTKSSYRERGVEAFAHIYRPTGMS